MRSITGLHAIEEYIKKLLDADSETSSLPTLVYSRKSHRIDELLALARDAKIPTARADEGEIDSRVGKGAHRGAILEVPYTIEYVESLREFTESAIPDPSVVLLLDGVTDPHNLGAILRSADQFGTDLVIIPARRSARVNDTVLKTSAGAAIQVPLVTVTNLTRAIKDLQEVGFWIYGGDMAGGSAPSARLSGKVGLVVGSEGAGLSRLVRESCDDLVRIPSFGSVDSLNVSVAAGVLLYEIRRQQGFFSE